MRVLVVGGGAREGALAWKLAQSPALSALFIAPGNPGTASLGSNIAIAVDDIAGLVEFARAQAIDLVVPGPEAPLALGLTDALAAHHIACFGPSQAAAQLETSKIFTKELCAVAEIPTAAWARFTDLAEAHAYIRARPAPMVVKADGLAAGKGVVVALSTEEALDAATAMLADRVHGAAGAEILVEDCLTGPEISFFALCDGETAIFAGMAQDHKRVGEGDTGPNTGGMGAIAPPPLDNPEHLTETVMARIIRPTLAAMAERGTPFRGFLFAGLMLTQSGPQLIEFNARFGDPECETLLPLIADDLLPWLVAGAHGALDPSQKLSWREGASATVVLAAKGYPGVYARGAKIDLTQAAHCGDLLIFHAGTAEHDGVLRSNGGRVLAVTATGTDLRTAIERAYRGVDAIDFPEGFSRRDIGARALHAR
ncbi:MAG: phosphoribosylamine--glycine ligase [Acidiphilium sp.]